MSALIPAIIQYVMSRRRRGGGGGGASGGGGGGQQDLNEIARKYMMQKMLYDMDNVDAATKDAMPDNMRTNIPQIRAATPKFSPVVPGVFQKPQG